MKRHNGCCIFCGAKGLSKEDYIPKWLKQYIAKDDWASAHTIQHSTYENGRTERAKPIKGRLQRGATDIQKTLRLVCRQCNGTWMSGLVNATKPVILSYIGGGWAVLNKSEATSLAAWTATHVMVREFATAFDAITPQERASFYNDRTPPKNWSIWVAQLTGGNPVVHSTLGGLRSELPAKGKKAPFVAHTFVAFLVLGRLIIHAVGTRDAKLLSHLRGNYSRRIGFTPIWFDGPLAVSAPLKTLTVQQKLSFVRAAPDYIMKGLVDGFNAK